MENSELFNSGPAEILNIHLQPPCSSNYIVTEKLLRLRSTNQSAHLIKLYEEDEDLLEDVIIEYKRLLKWLKCTATF